uniref:Uncharacterized protein n=1 Tax=Ciona savignyi TaxID=51511 RepID=H2YN22_CIOSA
FLVYLKILKRRKYYKKQTVLICFNGPTSIFQQVYQTQPPPYDGSEMDMDATNELFGELGDVFMNDSSNSSIVENKDDSESEA